LFSSNLEGGGSRIRHEGKGVGGEHL